MSIVNFDNQNEFEKFYRVIGKLMHISSGSEGSCFLGTDGFVYKVFDGLDEREINPYTIYTVADICSDFIIFPEDIYVVNDKLVGYKTKYIKNDVFLNPRVLFEAEGKENLIIKAFYEMVDEIKRLAHKKIFMYELAGNLMFDGNHFYVIDTCEYQHLPKLTEEEIVALNVDTLIYALELQFMFEENEILETFFERVKKDFLKNGVPKLS